MDRSRRSACRAGLAVLALTALATGCSAGPTTQSIPIVERDASPDLTERLLRVQDLKSAVASRSGQWSEVPVNRANLTENPDPRLPCGARPTVTPSAREGGLVVFRANDGAVTQFVQDLPADLGRRFIDEARRDARPGCPPYESDTPYGATQISRLLRVVDLGSLADQRFAAQFTARVGRGQTQYAAKIDLRRGRHFSSVTIFSGDPITDAEVRSLAKAAARRLARPGP